MNNSALILVDIQNDFMPGGALAVTDGDKIIPIANKIQNYFPIVVAVQDWHPANHLSFASNNPGHKCGEVVYLSGLAQILWPDHCIQDTYGAFFAEKLQLTDNVKIIRKGTNPHIDSYSGFFDNGHKQETKLREYLNSLKVNTIYIMGLATDYCVKNTVLDARKLGFKTYVIEDGCKGVNIHKDDAANAFKCMQQAGAIVINSNKIINN